METIVTITGTIGVPVTIEKVSPDGSREEYPDVLFGGEFDTDVMFVAHLEFDDNASHADIVAAVDAADWAADFDEARVIEDLENALARGDWPAGYEKGDFFDVALAQTMDDGVHAYSFDAYCEDDEWVAAEAGDIAEEVVGDWLGTELVLPTSHTYALYPHENM